MIRKISVIYIMIMMTAVSVYAGDLASVISQLEKSEHTLRILFS